MGVLWGSQAGGLTLWSPGLECPSSGVWEPSDAHQPTAVERAAFCGSLGKPTRLPFAGLAIAPHGGYPDQQALQQDQALPVPDKPVHAGESCTHQPSGELHMTGVE